MNVKKTQAITSQATTTRNVLSFILVLVIIGAAVGFYFGLQFIKTYAVEVSHVVTDSKAAGESEKSLSTLKTELSNGEELVGTANKLFSTSSTYKEQIQSDITRYASEAGITVISIDPSSDAAPAGPNKAPSAPRGSTPTDTSEVITIKSPVSYAKLIQFMQSIEDNLPKMQITAIGISRPAVASGDEVITDKITISVLTR